jgi:hypothetical protein
MYLRVNLLGTGPRLIKKNHLPGRSLTKAEKHCSTCFRRFFRPSPGAQKTVHTASGICQACLLLPQLELTHASGSSKQAWHIPDAVCTVLNS